MQDQPHDAILIYTFVLDMWCTKPKTSLDEPRPTCIPGSGSVYKFVVRAVMTTREVAANLIFSIFRVSWFVIIFSFKF